MPRKCWNIFGITAIVETKHRNTRGLSQIHVSVNSALYLAFHRTSCCCTAIMFDDKNFQTLASSLNSFRKCCCLSTVLLIFWQKSCLTPFSAFTRIHSNWNLITFIYFSYFYFSANLITFGKLLLPVKILKSSKICFLCISRLSEFWVMSMDVCNASVVRCIIDTSRTRPQIRLKLFVAIKNHQIQAMFEVGQNRSNKRYSYSKGHFSPTNNFAEDANLPTHRHLAKFNIFRNYPNR